MATIKVSDCNGIKELFCFDTLVDVPYLVDSQDEDINDQAEETDDGF